MLDGTRDGKRLGWQWGWEEAEAETDRRKNKEERDCIVGIVVSDIESGRHGCLEAKRLESFLTGVPAVLPTWSLPYARNRPALSVACPISADLVAA